MTLPIKKDSREEFKPPRREKIIRSHNVRFQLNFRPEACLSLSSGTHLFSLIFSSSKNPAPSSASHRIKQASSFNPEENYSRLTQSRNGLSQKKTGCPRIRITLKKSQAEANSKETGQPVQHSLSLHEPSPKREP
ncbi:hypothetical protein [Candidatus Methylacidiphilum infernorum]|uniref:hypothetical protein n=1 Tax=Candidatus Methylacidiphilum infernorum TaxID=511746 RepID=UPI0002FB305E|nr:hypothetical protein [Candidatus Methylacidiphilum infernorum]